MISQDVPEDDRGPREPEPGASGADAGKGAHIPPPVPVSYTYDSSGRSGYTYYAYSTGPDLFEFEHISAKGVFALTDDSGNTQYFRDRPARYLVVAPDSQTGKFAPAVKHGQPVYLWLCREDHEVE